MAKTYFNLAGGSFQLTWSNTGQVTTNNDWSGVPSIEGFQGQNIVTTTGENAGTALTDSTLPGDLFVIANQVNPASVFTGGVAKFRTDESNYCDARIRRRGRAAYHYLSQRDWTRERHAFIRRPRHRRQQRQRGPADRGAVPYRRDRPVDQPAADRPVGEHAADCGRDHWAECGDPRDAGHCRSTKRRE